MKGQSSVEYLTMLTAFFTIFLPIVLLFLSQTSIRSEPLKQDQVTTAATLLKQSIEEAYAACPSENSVLLALPSFKTKFSLLKEGERPYLKVESDKGSFAMVLDVVEANEAKGELELSGNVRVFVQCNIQEGQIGLGISKEGNA